MRHKRFHLAQDQLRELLKYDARKGVVTWKRSRGCRRAGQRASYLDKSGYRRIRIDKARYAESRVIWLLRTGTDPGNQQVDHRDGNKANNRFRNLRLATRSLNQANARRSKRNKTGAKGVCLGKSGKYVAQIRKDAKTMYLGTFPSIAEAQEAYRRAAIELFGDFARAA
jgi:hypothetical protein